MRGGTCSVLYPPVACDGLRMSEGWGYDLGSTLEIFGGDMASPADRRYSPTHEWHKVEGDTVVLGISQFAVDELTDVTYVDFRKTSGPIKAGEAFGEIESVKTTSELYSGIDGEIVAVNQEVVDNPGIINEDPYGKGWLIKIKASDPAQVNSLLDAATYDSQHS